MPATGQLPPDTGPSLLEHVAPAADPLQHEDRTAGLQSAAASPAATTTAGSGGTALGVQAGPWHAALEIHSSEDGSGHHQDVKLATMLHATDPTERLLPAAAASSRANGAAAGAAGRGSGEVLPGGISQRQRLAMVVLFSLTAALLYAGREVALLLLPYADAMHAATYPWKLGPGSFATLPDGCGQRASARRRFANSLLALWPRCCCTDQNLMAPNLTAIAEGTFFFSSASLEVPDRTYGGECSPCRSCWRPNPDIASTQLHCRHLTVSLLSLSHLFNSTSRLIILPVTAACWACCFCVQILGLMRSSGTACWGA